MSRKSLFQLFIVLSLGLIALSFTSCGGDDPEKENIIEPEETPVEEPKEPTAEELLRSKLAGTWVFEEATYADGTKVPKQTIGQIESGINQLIKSEIDIETLTFEGTKINGTEYTVEGNKLILAGTENSKSLTIEVKDVTEEFLTLDAQVSLLVTLKITILYKKQQPE